MKTEVHAELAHVSKSYRENGKVVAALDDLCLQIKKHEIVCFVGPSGCGKSTLLRIIAGLEKDFKGKALLKGRSIMGPGLDRGMVFQDHRLLPWLTVKGNLAFALQERCEERKEEVSMLWLKKIGLEGFEDLFPGQLSGGMAQRVALVRALVNRPGMLLLDEPFAALDALTRMRLQDELLQLWKKEPVTMILVTHDLEEAVFMGDRVVLLSERPGRIYKEVAIKLSRERDRNASDFALVKKELFEEFQASLCFRSGC